MQKKTGIVEDVNHTTVKQTGKKAISVTLNLDNSDETIIVRFTHQFIDQAKDVKKGDHIMIWYVYHARRSNTGIDYNNLYGKRTQQIQAAENG